MSMMTDMKQKTKKKAERVILEEAKRRLESAIELKEQEVLAKLGCRPVDAKDICLKPKLLKK